MKLLLPLKPRARISLVPMIDVLFILLAYFMVTSVYLDLDMIPVSETDKVEQTQSPTAQIDTSSLLVRIGSDGDYRIRGALVHAVDLESKLSELHVVQPNLQVLILPSMQADLQSLATILDTLQRIGIANGRVLRLESEQ